MFDAAALRGSAEHISVRGVEVAARAKSSVRGTIAEAEGVDVRHAPRGFASPRLEKYITCVKMRGRSRSRLKERPSDGGLRSGSVAALFACAAPEQDAFLFYLF